MLRRNQGRSWRECILHGCKYSTVERLIDVDDKKVNRNKKSIGLSFQHEEGVKILHELVKTSDVLVENYIPGMAT